MDSNSDVDFEIVSVKSQSTKCVSSVIASGSKNHADEVDEADDLETSENAEAQSQVKFRKSGLMKLKSVNILSYLIDFTVQNKFKCGFFFVLVCSCQPYRGPKQ